MAEYSFSILQMFSSRLCFSLGFTFFSIWSVHPLSCLRGSSAGSRKMSLVSIVGITGVGDGGGGGGNSDSSDEVRGRGGCIFPFVNVGGGCC